MPPDDTYRYRASKAECDPCMLKPRCCPNMPARKVTRSIYEGARDFARDARDEFHLAVTAQNLRKLAKLIPATTPATA